MTSVVIQPIGDALDHYDRTVRQPVKFGDYGHLIEPTTLSELRRAFPSGEAAMWGVKPGADNGPNPKQYAKIRVGDTVMFHDKGQFFAVATVACLFRNPALAERLWGRLPDGQTWEYMYAMDEVRSLDLSHAAFNAIVGYTKVPRNVTTIDDEGKTQALFARLPLESRRFMPSPSEEDYEKAIAELDSDLDVEARVRRRTEQNYLRHLLFPGVEANCHLCGRCFQIEFLVAAHIKKRAECTDTEKRDARHIVIAACRFGCDELFERGYITVAADGAIDLSPALRGEELAYAREHLAGQTLKTAMRGREDYFGWHRERSYRAEARPRW
jgi:hypothetical protein